MNGSSNILVLGVTGQVGKRVATNLKKRKANFSVGSRRKANLRELADQFGSSHLIDLDDPRTFDEALNNVTSIFLITGYQLAHHSALRKGGAGNFRLACPPSSWPLAACSRASWSSTRNRSRSSIAFRWAWNVCNRASRASGSPVLAVVLDQARYRPTSRTAAMQLPGTQGQRRCRPRDRHDC